MTEELKQDEREALKDRLDQLGVKYHPATGVEKLRALVEKALSDDEPEEEVVTEAVKESPMQRRNRLRDEASKLVRIRVTCMNPNKKEWQGEIFTVSNSVVGTFKKYVPFNAEDGWHVPDIIYKQIKNRKCQTFVTVPGPRGAKVRKGKLISEFAVEVLPPLTEEELKDLAQQQAMSGSVED